MNRGNFLKTKRRRTGACVSKWRTCKASGLGKVGVGGAHCKCRPGARVLLQTSNRGARFNGSRHTCLPSGKKWKERMPNGGA